MQPLVHLVLDRHTDWLTVLSRPAVFTVHPKCEEEVQASHRKVSLLLLLLQWRSQRGSLWLSRNYARYTEEVFKMCTYTGFIHVVVFLHIVSNTALTKQKQKVVLFICCIMGQDCAFLLMMMFAQHFSLSFFEEVILFSLLYTCAYIKVHLVNAYISKPQTAHTVSSFF